MNGRQSLRAGEVKGRGRSVIKTSFRAGRGDVDALPLSMIQAAPGRQLLCGVNDTKALHLQLLVMAQPSLTGLVIPFFSLSLFSFYEYLYVLFLD